MAYSQSGSQEGNTDSILLLTGLQRMLRVTHGPALGRCNCLAKVLGHNCAYCTPCSAVTGVEEILPTDSQGLYRLVLISSLLVRRPPLVMSAMNPAVACQYVLPGYLPSFRASPPLAGTHLYCLVNSKQRHVCEQLVQGSCVTAE